MFWFTKKPQLSVIVIFYNMTREAPRTLATLANQAGINPGDIEIIAIDNNSRQPLAESTISEFKRRLGKNFRYHFHQTDSVSPVGAVNLGVSMARADKVCVCIDGARMLSPGVISNMLAAFAIHRRAFVSTLGWHLGPQVQNASIKDGYCQAVEDDLLATVDWQQDGYQLFSVSSLAGSSANGWFATLYESNCFAIAKSDFLALGGFDMRFQTPGGGLVNLDFFRLACESPELTPVLLLGEGTFHQFHGGVATNVVMEEHPWDKFNEEYVQIRGHDYAPPSYSPYYLGHIAPQARRFL